MSTGNDLSSKVQGCAVRQNYCLRPPFFHKHKRPYNGIYIHALHKQNQHGFKQKLNYKLQRKTKALNDDQDDFWQPNLKYLQLERVQSDVTDPEIRSFFIDENMYKYSRGKLEQLNQILKWYRDDKKQLKFEFEIYDDEEENSEFWELKSEDENSRTVTVHISRKFREEQMNKQVGKFAGFERVNDKGWKDPNFYQEGSRLFTILQKYRSQCELANKSENTNLPNLDQLQINDQIKFEDQINQNLEEKQMELQEGLDDVFEEGEIPVRAEKDEEETKSGNNIRGGPRPIFSIQIEEYLNEEAESDSESDEEEEIIGKVVEKEEESGQEKQEENVDDLDPNDPQYEIKFWMRQKQQSDEQFKKKNYNIPLAVVQIQDDPPKFRCMPVTDLTPQQKLKYDERILSSVKENPEKILNEKIFGAWDEWQKQQEKRTINVQDDEKLNQNGRSLNELNLNGLISNSKNENKTTQKIVQKKSQNLGETEDSIKTGNLNQNGQNSNLRLNLNSEVDQEQISENKSDNLKSNARIKQKVKKQIQSSEHQNSNGFDSELKSWKILKDKPSISGKKSKILTAQNNYDESEIFQLEESLEEESSSKKKKNQSKKSNTKNSAVSKKSKNETVKKSKIVSSKNKKITDDSQPDEIFENGSEVQPIVELKIPDKDSQFQTFRDSQNEKSRQNKKTNLQTMSETDLQELWAPFSWKLSSAKSTVVSSSDRSKLFEAGFSTVLQVLNHYPRDYKDIRSLPEVGVDVLCEAKILDASPRNINNPHLKMAIWKFLVQTEDQDYFIQGAMFRRGPYAAVAIKKTIQQYKRGQKVYIKGPIKQINEHNNNFEFGSSWNIIDKVLVQEENLNAMYPPKKPLKSKDFKRIILKIFQKGYIEKLQGADWEWDPLPEEVVQKYGLMGWKQAISMVHDGGAPEVLEMANYRVAFQEFLALQLVLLDRRNLYRQSTVRRAEKINKDLMNEAMQNLQFELTDAQKRCLDEIIEDMCGEEPLLRLLQGDVGSGKTIVAFLSILAAVGTGYQAAIMAPTEVLANQLFQNFKNFLNCFTGGRQCVVEMLVGSTKQRKRTLVNTGIVDGSIQILVGTHALITESVEFRNLRMVVIDEQHKFGVEQRARLSSKCAQSSHMLAMSATPIPRTMALIAHGDMDVSIIDELPKGRQKIDTTVYVDSKSKRKEMNQDIIQEIKQGGQVFIVYPFIETSTATGFEDFKAAENEFKRIQKEESFGKGVSIALIHGRMRGDEKREIMDKFKQKEHMVLISTTVIEVGVDIPEASIMVVEHGERFGLAQLHQLRGRVGRGTRKSRCYITCNEAAFDRLEILGETNDGFKISEYDLMYRGGGDLLGVQQHGNDCTSLSRLAMQQIVNDSGKSLEQAKETAAEILGSQTLGDCDPKLQSMIHAYGMLNLDVIAELEGEQPLNL